MHLVSGIVAMSENNVIGHDNQLLWHLPQDLKHFKAITLGKPIVMGRKTYESIGRPLSGRRNIVLSSQADLVIPGCEVMHSVEEILEKTQTVSELMIVGGGHIYRLFFPFITRLYVTYVYITLEGETTFPEIDPVKWRLLSREDYKKDANHLYDYSFITFERNG